MFGTKIYVSQENINEAIERQDSQLAIRRAIEQVLDVKYGTFGLPDEDGVIHLLPKRKAYVYYGIAIGTADDKGNYNIGMRMPFNRAIWNYKERIEYDLPVKPFHFHCFV